MTMVGEGFEASIGRSPRAYADYVRTLDDPNQQLLALHPYSKYYHPNNIPDSVPAELHTQSLVDFAAESSSLPATVRVAALERALDNGYASYQSPYLRDTEPQDSNFRLSYEAASARHLAQTLITQDGLDKTIWFPDWCEWEIDRGLKDPDFNPKHAFGYLSELEQALKSPAPTPEAIRFAPLIADIHHQATADVGFDRVPANIRLDDWLAVAGCAELVKYGDNYRQTLAAIFDHDSGMERRYVSLIRSMVGDAQELAEVFPDRYAPGVRRGFSHVLADGLYAVLEHISNGGKTDTNLDLGGKGQLPLHLEGDEPLTLLTALRAAVDAIQDKGTSILTRSYKGRTINVAQNAGFNCLRLLDYQGDLQGVSLNVRPKGAETYNANLEYGRPGEGVEATIGFVYDAGFQPGTLTRIGKHRGPGDDKRISIRLDREGIAPDLRQVDGVRRDPTTEWGTLSLDVGSIIGDDNWLSTKLGRFLAWGNVLRTRAAAEVTQFNHVTAYFTSEDGHADVFAAEAHRFAAPYLAKQMTPDEVRQHFVKD